MMEKYLEGEEPTEDELHAAIRRATIAGKLTPVLSGSAFKNKGVQPMLDAVVGLPALAARRRRESRATRSATRRRSSPRQPEQRRAVLRARVQDHDRPAPGQADLHPRLLRASSRPAPRCSTRSRAARSASARSTGCTRTSARRSRRVGAGDIVAVMGLKDTTTGDTLCDDKQPGRARVDDLPGPGHPRGDRAEDQGRPGEAGHRDPAPLRRGPDLPGPDRRGDRPDDHRRHGRAAPRGARRPHAPRVQGRGQRRQAAGRLPRDDHQGRRARRLHAQEADRWLRPVREGPDRASSRHRAPPRARAATSSSTPSPVAASRASTSRRSTPAARRPWRTACSPATRWSTSR